MPSDAELCQMMSSDGKLRQVMVSYVKRCQMMSSDSKLCQVMLSDVMWW